ncbi:uncharacterized protein LOC127860749 [Dreissena polymorpha]|uniref:uncharacterized protein LOC127860749 n=1 Tax=Dreissena polymorpha TaxID=45954 RepID=UPI002264CE98|nr:uncharacterized protein LOC127860749 [Dreissena polymorpha]
MFDVQQMFYCFKVNKEHRDLLRFFRHKDNNPKKEIIEYRMTVHVFGNIHSPAVATYCLRKAVETADEDVRTFVNSVFYLDDALTSHLKEEEAIDLIKRTQETLRRSSIRLYKIASNSRVVISSFPVEDLAIDMTSFDISTDEMPDQASLGLKWNINADTFEFKINIAGRPFTRRGVVATVNSIFDPLGFLAPVTIEGKILVREIMNEATSSDCVAKTLRRKMGTMEKPINLIE